MSLFDKIINGAEKISLEKVNNKTRLQLTNNIISMLKNYGLKISYEEMETLNISLHTLMMPNKLISALKTTNFLFAEDEDVLKDTKILYSLTPILLKIDNINERYNGKPPSKYFRMNTYMSDEEMKKLNLTNEDRNYYIRTLFNSTITTLDVPKNLKSYIYTDENFNIVFKRHLPKRLIKEFTIFFVQNFATNNTRVLRKEYKNNVADLNIELLHQMALLNLPYTEEDEQIEIQEEQIQEDIVPIVNKICTCNKCQNEISYNDDTLEIGTNFSLVCPVCENVIILCKK